MRDHRKLATRVHRLVSARHLGIDVHLRGCADIETEACVLSRVGVDGVVPEEWAKARREWKGTKRGHVCTVRHVVALALVDTRSFDFLLGSVDLIVASYVERARPVLRAALDRRGREGVMPEAAYLSGQVRLPDWWVQRWLDTAGTVELPWPVPPTEKEVNNLSVKLADMEERLAKHAAIEKDAALVAKYAAEAAAKETERTDSDRKAAADAAWADDNGDAELLAEI